MRQRPARYDPYSDPDFARHDRRRYVTYFAIVCVAVILLDLFAAFGPELLAKLMMRGHGL